MHSYPKISIVTPSLNQASYIEKCIDSICQQGYPNFEHIVIDGNSQDGTVDILKQYSHIKWISEPDKSQSDALQKGFRMATGDYIGWLNCDDEYTPGTFHQVAKAIERYGKEEMIAGDVNFNYQGKLLRRAKNRNISFFRFLNPWIPYSNIYQQGVFLPKRSLEIIASVDKSLHYVMDVDIFCRLMEKKYKIHRVPETFANFNIGDDCKSAAGWAAFYPEWDKVVWKYATNNLSGLSLQVYKTSFYCLRPILRKIYKAILPPIF